MDSDEEETFICIGNPVEQIDEGISQSKDECLVLNYFNCPKLAKPNAP